MRNVGCLLLTVLLALAGAAQMAAQAQEFPYDRDLVLDVGETVALCLYEAAALDDGDCDAGNVRLAHEPLNKFVDRIRLRWERGGCA